MNPSWPLKGSGSDLPKDNYLQSPIIPIEPPSHFVHSADLQSCFSNMRMFAYFPSGRRYLSDSVLLCALCFSTCTSALMFPLPAIATPLAPSLPDDDASPPAITLPPRILRRQEQKLLGWLAPDNTCGYVVADPLFPTPKTCEAHQTCAVASALAGCCTGDIADCLLQVACINSQDMAASCDDFCERNSATVKCTEGAKTFCVSYIFPSWGATFYQCETAQHTDRLGSPIAIQTTSPGEKQGVRTWSTVSGDSSQATKNPAVSSSIVNPSSSASGATSGGDNGSSDKSDSGSASSSGSGSNNNEKGKSSTPIGAIVGGVIGGLAVIGLSAFCVTYLVIRERRRRRRQDLNPPQKLAPSAISSAGNSGTAVKQDFITAVNKVELPNPELPANLGGNPFQTRPTINGGMPAELDSHAAMPTATAAFAGANGLQAPSAIESAHRPVWENSVGAGQASETVGIQSARPGMENQVLSGATGNNRPGHRIEHSAL